MKRYDKILINAFIHLVLFFSFVPFFQNTYLLMGHLICCLMSFCILTVLLFQKLLVVFEPIVLFSLFDYFIILSYYYVAFQGFETNLFIQNYRFDTPLEYLLLEAICLNFVGYLFCISGYYLVRKHGKNKIDIEVSLLNTIYADVFIFISIFIGLLNFGYNNFVLGENPLRNPTAFFSNVGIINKFGTTIGYNFFIWAFFFFLLRRRNRGVLFKTFFFSTIFLSLTTGRIFQSIAIVIYVLSFEYFSSSITRKKNRLYITRMFFLLIFGVIFYALRYYSSSVAAGLSTDNFIENFINNFIFFAYDKGNLPSVAIQTIVLDGWTDDIGFMLGKSLIYPLFSILPSEFRIIDLMPGVLIKKTWFLDVPSGNLPATGVGEFYANFGIIGVCVGMFCFGMFGAYLFNVIRNSRSPIYVLIAILISYSFFILFPKGEINNISLFTPVCIFLLYKFLLFFSRYHQK